MSINLWSEADHARDYLERRQRMPRRHEGYQTLVELLPARLGRVLDLGTGDGHVMALVRESRPGVAGVAADFSAEMLDRARARFEDAPGIDVVEHDLDDPLPVEWGAFDAIVSAFAIHHVVDERKRALYGEVFDHLVPSGVLLNLEHVDSPTPELHDDFLYAIGSSPDRDDPSNKLVAVETQLGWLRAIGFAHVDCHWKWREMALLGGVKPA